MAYVRVSHHVIASIYRVLQWYSGNRGAGRAATVLQYYDTWRSLHALTVNISDEAWSEIRRIADIMNLSPSSREQEWMFLFAVETYLHLFVRALTLSKLGRAPRDFNEMVEAVDGMRNVFAPSVFEWVYSACSDEALDQQLRSDLKSGLNLVLGILSNLNAIALTADAFRDLYQNLIPGPLRRSLGEFYTREEIVDEVLDAAGFDCGTITSLYRRWRERSDKPVVLDPACGSGTFLVRVIRRIFSCLSDPMRYPPQDVASFVEDVVVGIDVNPFAVEMAKLNLMLAIADEMVRRCGALYVPRRIRVYWADSLAVVRENSDVFGSSSVSIDVPIVSQLLGERRRLSIPVLPNIDLDELVDVVHRAARSGKRLEELLSELERRVGRLGVEGGGLKELYEALSEVERAGNSRIVELIKNACIVASLIGKCDYVVGNPPWVRVHRVARHVMESLRRNYAYFRSGSSYNPRFRRTRVPFREQHDYSLAFVERGLQFLREGGVLGYVITSKILKTTYAGAMREDLVTNHTILELRDYSLYPRPLFQDAVNYPLIMVVRKGGAPGGHHVKVRVANTLGLSKNFMIPQAELPLDPNDKRSPWLTAPLEVIQAFRKIVQSSVRLGDVYEVRRGVMTSANELFVTDEVIGCSGGVASVRIGERTVDIEADLLHPFVRGADIDPFNYTAGSYVIFTHDATTFDPLWDGEQRRVLEAIGVLGANVRVEAAGGAVVYSVDLPCDSIQRRIHQLMEEGFDVVSVAPCAVTACYDVLKEGRRVLTLRLEGGAQNSRCRVYVEGLQLPGRPRATRHFTASLDRLLRRDDYRANLPPWAIFRVSKDKFEDYRIAWQEIARQFESCILPVKVKKIVCDIEKEILLVPDHKVYFIVERNLKKALKLLLYLNSDLARSLLKLVAWVTRGGYFEHMAIYVGLLPLPVTLLNCHVWSKVIGEAVEAVLQDRGDLNRIAEKNT